MPVVTTPTVRILVLEGFILEPGRAGVPGELADVLPHVANTAIALGKARLPTGDDRPTQPREAPHEPKNRDPIPTHRDPIPSRRKLK